LSIVGLPRGPLFSCLGDPGLHAIAKDLPLELGEAGEDAGRSA